MEIDQQKITALRQELNQLRARKDGVSVALLEREKSDEEIKTLLNESADLALKIEALETEIRHLEFPNSPDALTQEPGRLGPLDQGRAGF